MKNILSISSVDRISRRSEHSAFTDIIKMSDHLIVCYRQATNHVSADGHIEICRISLINGQRQYQQIRMRNTDLRDPKLSVDERGRLWLLAYARHTEAGKLKKTSMVSWFSDTGQSWSSAHHFGENYWWLWRIRWHAQTAYGFAYNRQANRVDFYAGHPGKAIEQVKSHALSLKQHGLGYPNESDLAFTTQGVCRAIVRRDADTFSAQLGESRPPYTSWRWKDLGMYVGGPVWLWLDETYALMAGRGIKKDSLVTQVWLLNINNADITELVTLPSGEDNSYPGLCIHGDTLFVSYYSGHTDNETRVYLARVEGINQLRNVIKQRQV